MLKHLGSISAAAIVLAASAVALLAQSEAPKPSGAVALGGYCPVAYVAMNQAVKGSPQHKSEYQGRTYYLTNAEAKAMFEKDKSGTIAKANANWPTLQQQK